MSMTNRISKDDYYACRYPELRGIDTANRLRVGCVLGV